MIYRNTALVLLGGMWDILTVKLGFFAMMMRGFLLILTLVCRNFPNLVGDG